MALTYNLDGNAGNLMMQDLGNNQLQFFMIDPMQWSNDNKFKLNIDRFISQVDENFNLLKENMRFNKKPYNIEFLKNSLITQHKNFIGAIKKGRENNQDEFMKESTATHNSNIIKEKITNAFIDKLSGLIDRLAPDEVEQELKIFSEFDRIKLEELFDDCYSENAPINNLLNSSKEDKAKGVQKKGFDNLLKNIEKIDEFLEKITNNNEGPSQLDFALLNTSTNFFSHLIHIDKIAKNHDSLPYGGFQELKFNSHLFSIIVS